MEPTLFRELRERFVGVTVPPLDGVITYLNRQGFNPNAVRPAAKAFLETMSYLEEMGGSESHGGAPAEDADSGYGQPQPENSVTPQDQQTKPLQHPASPKVGLLQEVFNLDEGPVTLSVPASLSEESYQDLEAQFQLFLRRAKRRVAKGKKDEAAN